MTVTKTGTPIDIDAERPKMPDRGLAKLHLAMEQLLDNIKVLNNQLKEYAAEQYNTLVELEKNIQNEFNLSNTLVQTDREAWREVDVAGRFCSDGRGSGYGGRP